MFVLFSPTFSNHQPFQYPIWMNAVARYERKPIYSIIRTVFPILRITVAQYTTLNYDKWIKKKAFLQKSKSWACVLFRQWRDELSFTGLSDTKPQIIVNWKKLVECSKNKLQFTKLKHDLPASWSSISSFSLFICFFVVCFFPVILTCIVIESKKWEINQHRRVEPIFADDNNVFKV